MDFIAKGLADLLDVETDFVKEQAADTAYYYKVIKRKVPEETAQEVRDFIAENDLSGIINLELDSRRYYPYGSLAAQVLGFVNLEDVGGEGLEAYYEAALTGNAGAIITTKGNRGTEMLYTYEKYYDASDGNSLVLTLDMTVQYYLEKNLEEAIEKYDVLNGAFGMVMDVDTGEILGMATLGSYDPQQLAGDLRRGPPGGPGEPVPGGAPGRGGNPGLYRRHGGLQCRRGHRPAPAVAQPLRLRWL